MLIERFNEKTKEFECVDSKLDFITFTGYGKTREIARYSYFSKTTTKPSLNIFNLATVA